MLPLPSAGGLFCVCLFFQILWKQQLFFLPFDFKTDERRENALIKPVTLLYTEKSECVSFPCEVAVGSNVCFKTWFRIRTFFWFLSTCMVRPEQKIRFMFVVREVSIPGLSVWCVRRRRCLCRREKKLRLLSDCRSLIRERTEESVCFRGLLSQGLDQGSYFCYIVYF